MLPYKFLLHVVLTAKPIVLKISAEGTESRTLSKHALNQFSQLHWFCHYFQTINLVRNTI